MKLNVYVVLDELSIFDPVIMNLADDTALYDRVRLFGAHGQESLDGAICIVGPNDVLQNASVLHNALIISPGFSQSEEVKDACLRVIGCSGWAGDVPRVFSYMQSSFERLAEWDYQIINGAASRISLHAMAQIVAQELKNPFALMDAGLRPLAIGGTLPTDIKGTIWEEVIDVDYTPNETFNIPPEELCFFEGRGRDPYFADIPRYPNYHNLIANVFQGGETIATLNTTTDMPHPISKGQEFLFCRARDAFEQLLSFQNNETVDDPALIYYITSLISGQSVDKMLFEQHLSEQGMSLNKSYCLYIAAGPANTVLEDARARFCMVRIKAHFLNAITFIHNRTIVIMSQPSKYSDESIIDLLNTLGLSAGKSMDFKSFLLIRQAYGQAKAALLLASSDGGDAVCHCYGDECFDVIVRSSDMLGQDGLYLCHPALIELYKESPRDLEDTLFCIQTYLVYGCNLAKASGALHMHRNTLAYRIERAESLLHMQFEQLSQDCRMHIWLSCRILIRLLTKKISS